MTSSDQQPATETWRATGCEPPIFFDPRGRRARVVKVAGGLIATAAALGLVLIVTAAAGFSTVPPLGAVRPAKLVHVTHHPHAAPDPSAGATTRVRLLAVKADGNDEKRRGPP